MISGIKEFMLRKLEESKESSSSLFEKFGSITNSGQEENEIKQNVDQNQNKIKRIKSSFSKGKKGRFTAKIKSHSLGLDNDE